VDLEHRQSYQRQYEVGGQPGFGAGTLPPAADKVQWADALPGALLAGVIVALCWMMPLLGLLLWPLVAGMLATLLYVRRHPETPLTRGMGARVGAMAGLFGFIAGAIVMVLGLVVAQGGGKMRQALEQMMREKVASKPGPEAQAMMEKLMTPEGLAVIVALSLLMFFALFVASGAAGGAIGAALTRKKNPPVR
jgi:vacuolar-type H+-ATPase subunit I/STV1